MLPVANAVAVKRRRVQGKRPPPEWYAALEVERFGEAGLAMLCQDARRFHVHYTHVRTRSPGHKQPDQLTRKQLWEHLVTVYREAYPCADSPTNSILQFGLVAKERHKDAPREEDRSEHNHVATFSDRAHYWRRGRKISADKYGILPPVGMKHENIIKVKHMALLALTVHPKPPASLRLKKAI